jgi:hypothetical protein
VGENIIKLSKLQARERPERPEVRPDSGIDGAELLDKVYEFLGRFIAYPNRHARVAHVLWIGHAHLMTCWETTPRLAFLSAEAASGKTRALEITELLVPAPVLAVNVSPAYLVRKIASEEGVTLLYDEIDTLFSSSRTKEGSEDVRGLLNGGYRRGAIVGRCYMQGSVAMTEELPSFAPVALAGLGNLPDTVVSRSIVVRMQRRAPNECVTPYRRRHHAEEGQRLCGWLASWAAAVADRIGIPDLPGEIADRDADCWEPLIAVADAAGSHWSDTARVSAVELVLLVRGEREESGGIRLLSDLRKILKEAFTPTAAILKALTEEDESPWADVRGKPLTDRGLALRLRAYGVKPKTARIGSATPRGYYRDDFKDAWQRYLPHTPEQ